VRPACGEAGRACDPRTALVPRRRAAGAWLRDPVERASFGRGGLSRGDRDVRMRIYPQLALFVVFR